MSRKKKEVTKPQKIPKRVDDKKINQNQYNGKN